MKILVGKGKVCWAVARVMQLISAGAYSGFYSINRLGVLLPLDGMLVYRRLPPQLLLLPNFPLGGEKQVLGYVSCSRTRRNKSW